jgi:CRP/FNR family transcriptional regulator
MKNEDVLKHLFEPELLQEMKQVGKIMSFEEDQIVINYEDKLKFFPIILSGTLKVLQRDENNNEILLYYLGANESCAMAYVFSSTTTKSELKVVTEEKVELLAIPHEKLEEWVVRYKTWRNYIFNSFSNRFNEMLKSIDSIAFHKLDERLADYLKTKAKITGRNSLALSHQQITEELGTNRVVVSRLLKQLENDHKVVLYRNEIKLLQNFGLQL